MYGYLGVLGFWRVLDEFVPLLVTFHPTVHGYLGVLRLWMVLDELVPISLLVTFQPTVLVSLISFIFPHCGMAQIAFSLNSLDFFLLRFIFLLPSI